MSLTRSILLLFLSFAMGFVGPLFVHIAKDQFGEMFANGTIPVLIVLALLWGTPRGIVERKVLEIVLGAGMAFMGLFLVRNQYGNLLHLVFDEAAVHGIARNLMINAFLGLFIGATDGLYERRAGKALLGAAISAVLGGMTAFVVPVFPEEAQEVFVQAFSAGTAICLIHLGTDITQFVAGSKRHEDKEHAHRKKD